MILNPLSALFLVVGVITGLFIAWLYTRSPARNGWTSYDTVGSGPVPALLI